MHIRALGATVIVAAVLPIARAGATDVAVACTNVGVATFSPRLTTALQSGTILLDYTYVCLHVDSSGASGTTSGSWSSSYSYSGSCVTATLSQPGYSGLLVGGVAAIQTGGNAGAHPTAFVPTDTVSNPCDMRTAAFTVTGAEIP